MDDSQAWENEPVCELGKSQSPINIVQPNVKKVEEPFYFENYDTNYNCWSKISLCTKHLTC